MKELMEKIEAASDRSLRTCNKSVPASTFSGLTPWPGIRNQSREIRPASRNRIFLWGLVVSRFFDFEPGVLSNASWNLADSCFRLCKPGVESKKWFSTDQGFDPPGCSWCIALGIFRNLSNLPFWGKKKTALSFWYSHRPRPARMPPEVSRLGT